MARLAPMPSASVTTAAAAKLGLGRQLLPPRPSDGIESRATVVVAGAPLTRDPALLFEAEQSRIDRTLVELQRAVGHLLDAPRNAIPVGWAQGIEGLKDHQVQ